MSDKRKGVDPIPDEFASYEEAAEFWDTHDTADYAESFETVSVEREFKHRRTRLNRRRDHEGAQRASREARFASE